MKRLNWQHWVKVIILTVIGLTIYLITYPTPPQYDTEMSYADWKEKMEEGSIDTIVNYTNLRCAIVHDKVTNQKYHVNVLSSTIFEQDLFSFASQNKELQYSESDLSTEYNYVAFFITYALIVVLFHFTWDNVATLIQLKKGSVEEGKNGKKKKTAIANHFLGEQYTPRDSSDSNIKFSDVIGLEKQLDDIQDVVLFLKEPQRYMDIGATLPKGILLYGKSGVGKTHIARAIAGEAEVPFYELSATEIESKWVGESEANIRKLFETARENAPSIIYLDEIDSIATKRFSNVSSNKHYVGVINQLLSCMDGFDNETSVVVIASTNHIEELDEAILRNGRFDRKIYIHEPDKKAREELIEYYAKGKEIADENSLKKLADITVGLTGADIKTILNEAAILSVRQHSPAITDDILMEAFRKVTIGTSSSHAPLSEEVRYVTAIHEAGHAIISHYFEKEIAEISIIPRGIAAGYNLKSPKEKNYYSFTEIEQEIMGLLGGRAAEEVFFQEVYSGAVNDLERVTGWIREMFLRYGMNREKGIGLVLTEDAVLNQKILNDLYASMNTYMRDVFEKTKRILQEQEDNLIDLAALLMAKETLSKEEIEQFFQMRS